MNSGEAVRDLSGPRQEYHEINNNIRHYSGLRFQVLTVYFAAAAGIGAVAFGLIGAQSNPSEFLKITARIGGFVTTALFFQYECLILEALTKNRVRGRELEVLLDYNQITARSRRALKVSNFALRSFYCAFAAFWLIMIISCFVS
jgi:hypothetical protein